MTAVLEEQTNLKDSPDRSTPMHYDEIQDVETKTDNRNNNDHNTNSRFFAQQNNRSSPHLLLEEGKDSPLLGARSFTGRSPPRFQRPLSEGPLSSSALLACFRSSFSFISPLSYRYGFGKRKLQRTNKHHWKRGSGQAVKLEGHLISTTQNYTIPCLSVCLSQRIV